MLNSLIKEWEKQEGNNYLEVSPKLYEWYYNHIFKKEPAPNGIWFRGKQLVIKQ